ncbi:MULTISPECIES: hypothetical protein [unclassified Vibrio]|uniref:hypothetical protein n=1 Tax=unclassified Vibrio TaxID=2614977 RepID=UPI000C84398F|nr:hypothetical protein [Vibrio sp. 10N.261.54.E10]PMK14628.1 hypothetical protein BCU07_22180 [Vibrio sp. 10N.261.54.E10]
MDILKDENERLLLILGGFSMLLLVISGARFPLVEYVDGTIIGKTLTSTTYISVFENILIGFLTAYVFYLLNNYFPKQRQKKDNLKLLNSCVASILDSYKRTRIWGHETALPYVNTECLDINWLKQQVLEIKKAQTNAMKLKFTLDTAHTRESDFKNLLQIASSISPEHAEKWLVLIDKVRLLSENYGKQPEASEKQMNLVRMRSKESPMHLYHLDLEFRIMELMEVTVEWLELE